MPIFECEGQWIIYDYNVTLQGYLCARIEWFDTYEEAFDYAEKEFDLTKIAP